MFPRLVRFLSSVLNRNGKFGVTEVRPRASNVVAVESSND